MDDPLQRVLAVTVTLSSRPDSNRRWLTPALKATDLDHSATTLRITQKEKPKAKPTQNKTHP